MLSYIVCFVSQGLQVYFRSVSWVAGPLELKRHLQLPLWNAWSTKRQYFDLSACAWACITQLTHFLFQGVLRNSTSWDGSWWILLPLCVGSYVILLTLSGGTTRLHFILLMVNTCADLDHQEFRNCFVCHEYQMNKCEGYIQKTP